VFVFPPDAYIAGKALYRSLPPASSEVVIGTVLMKRRSSSDPLLGGGQATLGRDIPQPAPDEMEADVKALDDFRIDYNKRRKATGTAREMLEVPRVATLI